MNSQKKKSKPTIKYVIFDWKYLG